MAECLVPPSISAIRAKYTNIYETAAGGGILKNGPTGPVKQIDRCCGDWMPTNQPVGGVRKIPSAVTSRRYIAYVGAKE
jgi:hypothetical protein